MKWPWASPYETLILWRLGEGMYCNSLRPCCSNVNNLGRLWLHDIFYVPKWLSGSLPQSRYKVKEHIPLKLLAAWLRVLSHEDYIFCQRIPWNVTLPVSKVLHMELMFLLSIYRPLGSPCIHVKWINLLLNKLLTTLHWTVFLWPNSWFCFHMKKVTKVSKCQMIWTTTAVLEISFKEVWTTYAVKIQSICWKHLHFASLILKQIVE